MDSVTQMLRYEVEAGALPGAIAVRSAGGVAETTAVGAQDLESGTPMSSDTLVVWDSLSKPLTAALALSFVADGAVELSTPIEKWLPELAGPRVLVDPDGPLDRTVPADRPVTVEDLLTLRGGLGFTTNFGSPFTTRLMTDLEEGEPRRTLDRGAFLSAAGTLPLAHQPGRGWTYNTGSTLLGLLLERVADQSLDVLMADRILDPLGMHSTRWWVPESERDAFASRYAPTDDPQAPLALVDPPNGQHSRPPSFPDGAGGLIGTADDWLAFGRMLLGGGQGNGRRILPAALVESMMTDHLSVDQRAGAGFFLGDGEGWGYGGSVRRDHTYGWAGGVGTTARVDPRRDRVDILFTQVALDGPEGSRVINAFEELVAGA